MKIDTHNRTYKKQTGTDTTPGHKGKTLRGSILSMPKMYQQALTVTKAKLNEGQFDAARFVIEQVDGKAKQKVDVTTDGKQINTPTYDFTGLSIEQQRAIRDALRSAKKQ